MSNLSGKIQIAEIPHTKTEHEQHSCSLTSQEASFRDEARGSRLTCPLNDECGKRNETEHGGDNERASAQLGECARG